MLASRRWTCLTFAIAALSIVSCNAPTDAPSILGPEVHLTASATSSNPTVNSADPGAAQRGITLDVKINGSGFDATAKATFQLNGVVDPRVRVNSTRYVKSTQVVANVTIASDAALSLYDVAVALSSGKKAIGSRKFEVQLPAEILVGGVRSMDVNASGDAIANYPTAASCPAALTVPGVIALFRLDGTKTLLALPSSGLYCSATGYAINNSGMVLGRLDGVSGVSAMHAIWTPAGDGYTIVLLGLAPDGYRPFTGGGFNNAGEVIGWTNLAANVAKVYWWSQATGWLPIPVPSGATICQVYEGINDRGEIVGKCTVGGVSRPYYWQNHSASPVVMPTPAGATNVTPKAINNSGVVVGYGPVLRWTPNGSGWIAEKLPDAGLGGAAYAISEDGSVAGSVERGGFSGPLPAVWPQGGAYRLLSVSAGSWGEALSIASTSEGIVVVGADRGKSRAMRWRVTP